MRLPRNAVWSNSILAFTLFAAFSTELPAKTGTQGTHPATQKPSKPKPTPPPKKPEDKKYFVDLYTLPDFNVTPVVANGSRTREWCGTQPLTFPATNANEVVSELLNSEPGYSLKAVAPNKIAIYYKSATPDGLTDLRHHMDQLASPDFSHAVLVQVPGGSARKVVSQIRTTSDVVPVAVDDNCILVLSRDTTNPVTIMQLSRFLPDLYWEEASTSPTQRLFYLDTDTTAKKLSALGSSGGQKDDGNKSDSQPASDRESGAGTEDLTGKEEGEGDGESADDSGASGDSADASPDDPSGAADANNAAKKKAARGNSDRDNSEKKKDKDKNNKTDAAQKAKPDSDKKPTPSSPGGAHSTLAMVPINDTLVYSNPDGSDRGIFQRNRLLAVLDLPRPEVLMNVWSLQVSTRDAKTASQEADAARELVAHNNGALEDAIEDGWRSLSEAMKSSPDRSFFDPTFYDYITKKFVEPYSRFPGSSGISDDMREKWGWCRTDQYCLGYAHAFEPLRPTLTNILLGITAARQSKAAALETIRRMQEGWPDDSTPRAAPKPCGADSDEQWDCFDKENVDKFDRCVGAELQRLQTLKQQSAVDDCELEDRISVIKQVRKPERERLQLRCFAKQAEQSFDFATDEGKSANTRVGLLRAAIADFLFNYKWSVVYPHDFNPYYLTQSAQELNAEFNPLVLAFNRDVSAFTQNLQTELQCKHDANHTIGDALKWFGHGDETFLNDGMVGVRGISGVESIVDTVTQSFFDATKPPSLSDLVKSVSEAEKNVPGVLKANLSAHEAAVLLGALNSVQPAEAKIGRELKLDITPHALAGASSAELEVKLTAEEQGNPTRFTADKSAEDTLSRVAKHDATTRVRVESLKLFEVSAFSAMLQRPRSKFPILPPFFEVPYFGSFIGWPVPGAKVYHRSTAIVSAVIVPTAADLAFGIEFSADRLCDRWKCDRAHSPDDFGLALANYHNAILQCFATAGKTAYAGRYFATEREGPCTNLSLESVPPRDRRIVGPGGP